MSYSNTFESMTLDQSLANLRRALDAMDEQWRDPKPWQPQVNIVPPWLYRQATDLENDLTVERVMMSEPRNCRNNTALRRHRQYIKRKWHTRALKARNGSWVRP